MELRGKRRNAIAFCQKNLPHSLLWETDCYREKRKIMRFVNDNQTILWTTSSSVSFIRMLLFNAENATHFQLLHFWVHHTPFPKSCSAFHFKQPLVGNNQLQLKREKATDKYLLSHTHAYGSCLSETSKC